MNGEWSDELKEHISVCLGVVVNKSIFGANSGADVDANPGLGHLLNG